LKIGLAEDVTSKQGLEVSPPSQELKASPDSVVYVKAKIRNKGTETINIKVRIEDFTASGQEGQVALVDKGVESLAKWAVLDVDTFTLKPFEYRDVTASISLPSTVAGGLYGSFVFSVDGGNAGPNAASLSQELASLFLIKVSGPVNEEMIMSEFSAPVFSEFGPVNLNMKFINTGNVHLKPFGLVNVRNIFGKTVKDIVVRGETNIFPGASRYIRVSFDNGFLIGPYTAQALINFGTENESISMTTRFFVFPLRYFAALLLVGLVIFKARRRIVKAVKALSGK